MNKLSLKKIINTAAAAALAAALLLALPACSPQQTPEVTSTPAVSLRTFAPPTPTPELTPEPSPSPTPRASTTPKPEPVVSFPPFQVDSSGDYIFPQVVSDKTEAMTNEAVYFNILTSEKVNSVQTVIDGVDGGIYKDFKTDNGMRIWRVRIYFTNGGNRKVQFKCAMSTGGTAIIPKNPVKINITFNYTAESTSKNISKGKTVTFTLKTPSTIDSVDAVVDGVKQNIKCDKPESDEGGIRVWKVNITFFGLGTRSVTFQAYDGTNLKQTFPDPGLTIIVE